MVLYRLYPDILQCIAYGHTCSASAVLTNPLRLADSITSGVIFGTEMVLGVILVVAFRVLFDSEAREQPQEEGLLMTHQTKSAFLE
jgi:hypothetical protein